MLDLPSIPVREKGQADAMSTDDELSIGEVSELTLSMHSAILEPWTLGTSSSSAPGLTEVGPGGSLVPDARTKLENKTDALRRLRLAAAASFLALVFAVLLLAHFLGVGLAAPTRSSPVRSACDA